MRSYTCTHYILRKGWYAGNLNDRGHERFGARSDSTLQSSKIFSSYSDCCLVVNSAVVSNWESGDKFKILSYVEGQKIERHVV